MAYWVKIQDQRKEYIINIDHVNTFCYEKNGRITFWLPNSYIPIVINPHSNWEDYQKISKYIEYAQGVESDNAYWVKITYERKDYVINLNYISSFCQEQNGRLTFWLPDINFPIIINPTNNAESYEKVIYFLEKHTGFCFGNG
ncbi:hypothetical protein H6G54_14430 [Anabaena cylindrica FACHB-243]|uniref:Uncharacterized protein n=1 Tax=Anabaena cylindrica (strain ATCC 27899 / PCC 7122) TaxID=272123 RepID=K9ZF20_ANACC|nr:MULTISPECIES: hypothetical protein [Anabaena]AFZ56965.1 hypothetical protein Anacy_1456 [Anabaena cylindrica PCC 7122]MBD2418874.1 hypothetical protein [Anabaena cylindrica FACHB-243]MBY5284914.1 hypothetical protein [Anabaena sp. CCAP 1446/1C]MBY5310933.1 hypothetical protein [Anabaena sp. CCAP 1446/1C]MCM2405154.1 hypothetical protein [Anabaena sp. CCAP 1446/1C]